MKVILSGATGFIGREVLCQALLHPAITSLICISRKPLSDAVTSNPKIKVIVLEKFDTYPVDVLAQMEGAEACLWAMGSPAHKNPNLEDSRKVEVGFTHAAAQAFEAYLAPPLKAEGRVFRFVYLSGMLAERVSTKSLWFLNDVRMMKGETENGLLALQKKEDSNFEVSIVRPGGVLAKDSPIPGVLIGITKSIKVDELAAAMIYEVIGGVRGERTLENGTLRSKGLELLHTR